MKCTNLSPGFRCESCPVGFKGHLAEGFYMEAVIDHTFERQFCEDIDECDEGIAQCGRVGVCRFGQF